MNFSCIVLDLKPKEKEEFYKLRNECSLFLGNVPIWDIKEFEQELEEENWWEENINYPYQTTFLTSQQDINNYFGQFKHR